MRNLGKMSDIREVKTGDIAWLWIKNPVSKTMDSEDLCLPLAHICLLHVKLLWLSTPSL